MKMLLLCLGLFLGGCSGASLDQDYHRRDTGTNYDGPEIKAPSQEKSRHIEVRKSPQTQPAAKVQGWYSVKNIGGKLIIEKVD